MTTIEPFARTDRAPRSRRRLALVHGGSHFHLQTLKDPAVIAHQPEFLYLAGLTDGDLDAFDTVILADRLHPELLRRHTAQILAVAQRGGTLVVLGENAAHTWLPGVSWTARPTNFWWWLEGEDPLIRTRSPEHEAWEYLSTNRRSGTTTACCTPTRTSCRCWCRRSPTRTATSTTPG
ncbi:hypothetical protein J2X34_004893 [Rhodococcus sp. BE178]